MVTKMNQMQKGELKHGCSANLQIDKEKLLDEARKMEGRRDNKLISIIGTKYGLLTQNRGQLIKEFLAEHNIQAAKTVERQTRAHRRSKKKSLSPVKERVKERIDSEEIYLGEEVVRTTYTFTWLCCTILII